MLECLSPFQLWANGVGGNHVFCKTLPYSGSNGQGPFVAIKFGKLCPHRAFSIAVAEGGVGAYAEDCLTLNVWTPVHSPGGTDEKWPVRLWLHGGWFQVGDPSHDTGMHLIELISPGKLNTVVVAISYRLNFFGFLANERGANYELWHPPIAIEWVHENISHFGGDLINITLVGRSAGAYSGEARMLYEFRRPQSSSAENCSYRAFIYSNAISAQPKSISDARGQFDEVCAYFERHNDVRTR